MENTIKQHNNLDGYLDKTKEFVKFVVFYGTAIIVINTLLYILGADTFDALESDGEY